MAKIQWGDEMIIYPAEKEIPGLAEQLVDPAKSRLSYDVLVELNPTLTDEERKNTIAKVLANFDNRNEIVLHYLKTILVTSGWNKNDDVFDKGELWAARRSPIDTPFNFEHDPTDIIGHITDCYPVDTEYNIIADETDISSLPPKFHLLTHAVLYKHLADTEWNERMSRIIAEIMDKQWFVSMETLFQDFDYALIKGGEQHILKRNESSAFLTKYLRAYGGTGQYNDYKVGRLLRKLTFSGKGLVKKPGNPESIIFDETESFAGTACDINSITNQEDNNNMSEKLEKEISELKATVATLTKERDEAKAAADAAAKAAVEAEISELKESVASKDEELNALNAKIAEIEATLAELTKARDEAVAAADAAKAELETIKAAQIKTNRIAKLIGVGMEESEAVAKVEKFASLNDELFDEIVALAKVTPAVTPSVTEEDTPPSEPQGDTTADLDAVLEAEDIALATAGELENDKEMLEGLSKYLSENFLTKSRK